LAFFNRLISDTKSYVTLCRGVLAHARNTMLVKYAVNTNAQLHFKIAADWPCRPVHSGGPKRAWEGSHPPHPYRVHVPRRFLMGTRRTPANDEGSTIVTTTKIWHGPGQDVQLIIATILLLHDINNVARSAMEEFLMVRSAGPRRSAAYGSSSASLFTTTPPLPPLPPPPPLVPPPPPSTLNNVADADDEAVGRVVSPGRALAVKRSSEHAGGDTVERGATTRAAVVESRAATHMQLDSGTQVSPLANPMPSVHMPATLAASARSAGRAEAVLRASVAKAAADSLKAAEMRRKRVEAASAGVVGGPVNGPKRPRTTGSQAAVGSSAARLATAGPPTETPSSGREVASRVRAADVGAPADNEEAKQAAVRADARADPHVADNAGGAVDSTRADAGASAVERFMFRFPAPPKKKGGAQGLEDCVVGLRSMVLRAVCKAAWPVQLCKATSVEAFVPDCQDTMKEIIDNQARCAFILCESDLAKATIAATDSRLPSADAGVLVIPEHCRVCAKVEWSKKDVSVVLTPVTIANMRTIRIAKCLSTHIQSAKQWLQAVAVVRPCGAEISSPASNLRSSTIPARACTCLQCTGGDNAAVLADGTPLSEKVRMLEELLMECPYQRPWYKYAGASPHEVRYRRTSVHHDDALSAFSTAFLSSYILAAALIELQETARAADKPFFVVLPEEAESILGVAGGAVPSDGAVLRRAKAIAEQMSSATKILILINLGSNTHWAAAEIDLFNKSTTYMDSLADMCSMVTVKGRLQVLSHALFMYKVMNPGCKERDEFDVRANACMRGSGTLLNRRCRLMEWTESIVSEPRQSDGYNCGAFAVMHLRQRVLGGGPLTIVSGSGNHARVKLMYDLFMAGRGYDQVRQSS